MRKLLSISIRIALLVLSAAFSHAQTDNPQLTGSVSYRERVALPADAAIDIQLIDTSVSDLAAQTVAESLINAQGRQVPVSFTLTYDPAQIVAGHRYSVRASIRSADGMLMFSTTQAYPVLTHGAPSKVNLILHPVGHGAKPGSAAKKSPPATAQEAGSTTQPAPPATAESAPPVTTAPPPASEPAPSTATPIPQEPEQPTPQAESTTAPPASTAPESASAPTAPPTESTAAPPAPTEPTQAAPAPATGEAAQPVPAPESAPTATETNPPAPATEQPAPSEPPVVTAPEAAPAAPSTEPEPTNSAGAQLVAPEPTPAPAEARPAEPEPSLPEAPSASKRAELAATAPEMEEEAPEGESTSRPERALPNKGLTPLADTQWKLIQLGSEEIVITPPQKPISLAFSPEGRRIAGSAGCNTYIGTFSDDHGTLHLNPGSMTLIACDDPAGTREKKFVAMLRSADGYKLDGDVLLLTRNGKTVAKFTTNPPM